MKNAQKTIIAIIPARGNSKRLPKKNILNFMGKPIMEWTIKSAIKSKIFNKIIVSSEDKKILQIAKKNGVDLHKRNLELSSDNITVEKVCCEIINEISFVDGMPDIICCLYATAPLRTADDIKKTVSLVSSGRYDKAFAVTSFDLPVHQAIEIEKNSDKVIPVFPNLINMRADNVKEFWVDNGSTYVSRVDVFLKDENFMSGTVGAYRMSKSNSVDIDTKKDYEMALYFAQKVNSRRYRQ